MSILTLFVLPFVVIVATYATIFVTLHYSALNFESGRSKQRDPENVNDNRRRLIKRAKSKALRMSVVIVLAFLVCWAPYYYMMVLHVFWGPGDQPSDDQESDLDDVIFFFGMSNSLVNPLIYGAFHLCGLRRNTRKGGVRFRTLSGHTATTSTRCTVRSVVPNHLSVTPKVSSDSTQAGPPSTAGGAPPRHRLQHGADVLRMNEEKFSLNNSNFIPKKNLLPHSRLSRLKNEVILERRSEIGPENIVKEDRELVIEDENVGQLKEERVLNELSDGKKSKQEQLLLPAERVFMEDELRKPEALFGNIALSIRQQQPESLEQNYAREKKTKTDNFTEIRASLQQNQKQNLNFLRRLSLTRRRPLGQSSPTHPAGSLQHEYEAFQLNHKLKREAVEKNVLQCQTEVEVPRNAQRVEKRGVSLKNIWRKKLALSKKIYRQDEDKCIKFHKGERQKIHRSKEKINSHQLEKFLAKETRNRSLNEETCEAVEPNFCVRSILVRPQIHRDGE